MKNNRWITGFRWMSAALLLMAIMLFVPVSTQSCEAATKKLADGEWTTIDKSVDKIKITLTKRSNITISMKGESALDNVGFQIYDSTMTRMTNGLLYVGVSRSNFCLEKGTYYLKAKTYILCDEDWNYQYVKTYTKKYKIWFDATTAKAPVNTTKSKAKEITFSPKYYFSKNYKYSLFSRDGSLTVYYKVSMPGNRKLAACYCVSSAYPVYDDDFPLKMHITVCNSAGNTYVMKQRSYGGITAAKLPKGTYIMKIKFTIKDKALVKKSGYRFVTSICDDATFEEFYD